MLILSPKQSTYLDASQVLVIFANNFDHLNMRKHKIYKLSLENESTLENIYSIRMSPIRLIITIIAATIFALIIVGALIMSTPLRTLLPGYLSKNERINTIEVMMRLDSLTIEHQNLQTYLNNILTIYDTDRELTDSVIFQNPSKALPLDSLLPVSQQEAEFIKMMEEKEKYNISILAPLAAEGMIFVQPADASIIAKETENSFSVKIIPPIGADINAISDGIIIDSYYSGPTGAYTLVIQHNKGFLSKYSGIGQPLVEKGNTVTSGQRIAFSNDKVNHFILEMWRNGTQIKPYNYIKEQDFNASPIVDEDIGRGR